MSTHNYKPGEPIPYLNELGHMGVPETRFRGGGNTSIPNYFNLPQATSNFPPQAPPTTPPPTPPPERYQGFTNVPGYHGGDNIDWQYSETAVRPTESFKYNQELTSPQEYQKWKAEDARKPPDWLTRDYTNKNGFMQAYYKAVTNGVNPYTTFPEDLAMRTGEPGDPNMPDKIEQAKRQLDRWKKMADHASKRFDEEKKQHDKYLAKIERKREKQYKQTEADKKEYLKNLNTINKIKVAAYGLGPSEQGKALVQIRHYEQRNKELAKRSKINEQAFNVDDRVSSLRNSGYTDQQIKDILNADIKTGRMPATAGTEAPVQTNASIGAPTKISANQAGETRTINGMVFEKVDNGWKRIK